MRKLGPEVACEPVQNLTSPGLVTLPFQDGPAVVPVKLDHGGIHDPLRPLLGLPDKPFQGRDSGRVVSRKGRLDLGHESTLVGASDVPGPDCPDTIWTIRATQGPYDVVALGRAGGIDRI